MRSTLQTSIIRGALTHPLFRALNEADSKESPFTPRAKLIPVNQGHAKASWPPPQLFPLWGEITEARKGSKKFGIVFGPRDRT